MGNIFTVAVPSSPAVPAGITRICVSGVGASHHTGRAQKLASLIAKKYPTRYETWFYFSSFGFHSFLKSDILPRLSDDQKSKPSTTDKGKTVGTHSSSPFVWLETSGSSGSSSKEYTALGGRDLFCQWANETFPDDTDIKTLTATEPGFSEVWFDNQTPGGTHAKK
jgi:hypothetical protein